MKNLTATMTLIAMWLSFTVYAEEMDATAIVTKAYETKRVDDQIATLTFTFSAPGKEEQRVIYSMVWKNMKGEDGYDDKAMFFTESPAEKREIAYLGWLRPADSAAQDDEWIYLPELRMTRRLVHRDHDHSHDDDEFGNSILRHEHLEQRPPHIDTHILAGEENLDGKIHYLIASTPKQHHTPAGDHMSHDMPGKIIRWIDKESYLINRVQFFGPNGEETLDMRIRWTQIDNFWVWQTVAAIDPRNQAKTVMQIDKIRINSGLKNEEFSKRTLSNWPNRFH